MLLQILYSSLDSGTAFDYILAAIVSTLCG